MLGGIEVLSGTDANIRRLKQVALNLRIISRFIEHVIKDIKDELTMVHENDHLLILDIFCLSIFDVTHLFIISVI